MAATNPLGSFAVLVDRLTPIAEKRRGMRIEADDWNALVGVVRGLLELEYQQEANLETAFRENFAPRRHEHTGEIGLGALDADLRARLTGEDGGGVATRFSLSRMQSKLDALSTEVARLTALAAALQSQLDRAQVDDLDRSAMLRGFEERFTQVEALRGVVSGLNRQVGALGPGVEAVVRMRDALGAVDLPALQTRIADLESLRASLTGPDGKPLRMREVVVQLDELREVVRTGTSGGLEERFLTLEADIDTKLDTRLNEGLEATRAAGVAQAADVRKELDNRLETRLEAVRGALAQQADERARADRAAVEATLETRLGAVSADLRETLSAEATAQIDGRLAGLSTQISTAARGAVAAAAPDLRAQVGAAVRTDVEARLAAAEAAVAARADALDARFAESDRALSAQVADRVAQELPAIVDAGLARGTQALSTQLTARVDQQLVQSRDALGTTLRDLATAAVGAALGDVDARVAKQVGAQIAGLQLDDRFARHDDSVVTRVRQEIEASTARLREEIATVRNEDRTILNGQIERARDEAVDVSLDRIGTLQASHDRLATRLDKTEQTVLTKADVLVRDRTSTLENRLTRIESVNPTLGPARGPINP